MHKRILAAAAAVTVASTLGITANAQAQPAGPAISSRALATSPHHPAAGVLAPLTQNCDGAIEEFGGVWVIPAFFYGVILCTAKGGTPPYDFTTTPPRAKLPKTVLTFQVGPYFILAGIWPAPGPHKVHLGVSDSATPPDVIGATLKVSSAPANPKAIACVGSGTTQDVMDQLGLNYNNKTGPTGSDLYCFEATNPITGAVGDSITTKSGCSSIARPDGSSAGITALTSSQVVSGIDCVNLARSARPRSPSDPPYAPGGVAFVNLAEDAVSYATQATTSAPGNLTTAQLAAIYNCSVTNWSQVGGANAPIHAFIPQSGSETRAFFLSAIGLGNPGSCVSDDGGTLQQDEGVNPVLNDPDAIVPYSVGTYIAEKFHSAACLNSDCTPNTSNITCEPAPGVNLFGCDTHGTTVLRSIDGTAPTVRTGKGTTINPHFTATFMRTVYNVVPYDSSTADHIPGAETGAPGGVNLEPLLGASGFVCTSVTAKTDLKNYGFLVIPTCGATG